MFVNGEGIEIGQLFSLKMALNIPGKKLICNSKIHI